MSRKFLNFLFVPLFAIMISLPARPQTAPAENRDDVEKELEKIKQQLEAKTDSLENLAQQERRADLKSRSLREEMELLGEVSNRLDQRYRHLDREHTASERRVTEFEKGRMFRQEVLSRTLHRLYTSRVLADQPEASLDGSGSLRRRYFGRLVGLAQVELVVETADSLAAWTGKRNQLAESRQKVKQAAAGKQKEIDGKERQLAGTERKAFALRQQREQEMDRIEQIQREAMILSELIDRLAALPGVERALDYDFPGWQGRLHWPLKGTVKSTVGAKIDPKYRTETYESGIFIAGTPGAEVVNAADGEVAYAGRRRGLGNVVVVGHGSGYFSIFAHLDEISVLTGAVLRAGEKVGTVGQSHPRFGAGVLFELRRGKEILDPLEWLR